VVKANGTKLSPRTSVNSSTSDTKKFRNDLSFAGLFSNLPQFGFYCETKPQEMNPKRCGADVAW
jgi:hypothetical protein